MADHEVSMETSDEIQSKKRSEIYAAGGDWDEMQKKFDAAGLGDPTTSRVGDLSNRPVGPEIPGTNPVNETETPVPVTGSFAKEATQAVGRGSYGKK